MNKNVVEFMGLKKGLIAGTTGARVNAGQSDRIGILVLANAATEITILQHNAASAGISKALETDNNTYTKLDAAAVFTKFKPAVGAVENVYTISGAGLFYIEIESSQLDTNGGFNYLSVNADVAADSVYFLNEMRYQPAYDVSI